MKLELNQEIHTHQKQTWRDHLPQCLFLVFTVLWNNFLVFVSNIPNWSGSAVLRNFVDDNLYWGERGLGQSYAIGQKSNKFSCFPYNFKEITVYVDSSVVVGFAIWCADDSRTRVCSELRTFFN